MPGITDHDPGISDHDAGIGDHVKSESVITIVRNTQEWAEKDAKIAAKREREDAMGKAEFVRSLDPKSSKEQTWNERELGQKWKKNNWSEAWQIERAAEAARPKQEPGLERDSGWRGR